jgi:hypothetical protein
VRDGADVAELTGLLTLLGWPAGVRVIVRRERPHPGAQLSLFEERDGWRYTAVIRQADPTDKAKIYRQLGLRLTYDPETRTVRTAVNLGTHRGAMVGVRGSTQTETPRSDDAHRGDLVRVRSSTPRTSTR